MTDHGHDQHCPEGPPMTEHHAAIRWANPGSTLDHDSFSRDHEWSFKGGRVVVPGSAAPAYKGSAAAVDPEDALVAALSACHMLTFLAIAAKRRLVVLAYSDAAVGILEPDGQGRLAITRVTLRPVVTFAPATTPDDADYARLHAKAHEHCFIAHSVRAAVTIEPVRAVPG
jgi:organic hydroperoxide reductase OsmC/OhrA